MLVERAEAHCRAAVVTLDSQGLRLSGDGIDVWRAACELAWSRADIGAPLPAEVLGATARRLTELLT